MEKIISASRDNIKISVYDTDELPEEQRRHLCRKAVQTASEVADVKFLKNPKTSMSKYYSVITTSNDRRETPPSSEDFIQAFECPTEPKIYVHVSGFEKSHTLWTIMRKSVSERRPILGILRYEMVLVKSISLHTDCSLNGMENEQEVGAEKDELEGNSLMEDEIERKLRLLEIELTDVCRRIHKLRKMQPQVEKVGRGRDLQAQTTEDAEIDISNLSKEERQAICERAIKIALKENVKFTGNDPGPNVRYIIQRENEGANNPTIIKAFECRTNPRVYVHVTENKSLQENEVWVILKSN